MARLTACFALSAVLLLATGICSVTGQMVSSIVGQSVNLACKQTAEAAAGGGPLKITFDLSGVPPMRIFTKANISLTIAANYTAVQANETNQVVLAEANCADSKQLWIQHFPVEGENRFALVNTDSQANPQWVMNITDQPIPDNDADKGFLVKLVRFNPLKVQQSMLWQQNTTDGDGFIKIRSSVVVNKKGDFVYLDAMLSPPVFVSVDVGTVVGAYNDDHDKDNVFWKILGLLSKP